MTRKFLTPVEIRGGLDVLGGSGVYADYGWIQGSFDVNFQLRLINGPLNLMDYATIKAFTPGATYDVDAATTQTHKFQVMGVDKLTVSNTEVTLTGDLELPTGYVTAKAYSAYDDTSESFLKHIGCDSIWANDSIQAYKPIYLDGIADVPTNPRHAASKSYVDGLASQATLDARYVNVTGDVITGPLNMHGTTLVFKDAPGTTTYGTLSGDSFGVRVASDLLVNDELTANGYSNLNAGANIAGVDIPNGDITFNTDGTEWGIYWNPTGASPDGGRLVHTTANGMLLQGDKPGQQMRIQVRNAANSAHVGLTLTESVITSSLALMINQGGDGMIISDSPSFRLSTGSATRPITFTTGGTERLRIDNVGLTSTVPVVLPADPTTALQAATKQYVDAGGGGGISQAAADARYVNLDGDTMTADLVVPDEAYSPVAWDGSLEVPTKNAVRDVLGDLSGFTVADWINLIDGSNVNKDGDTMTGTLAITQSGVNNWFQVNGAQPGYYFYNATPTYMGGFWMDAADTTTIKTDKALTLPAAPTLSLHAATKQYVDVLDVGTVIAGTTHTLALANLGKLLRCDSATAVTITIPTNATVPFPQGAQVHVIQWQAGKITFVGAGGVNVYGTPSLITRTQFSMVTLVQMGINSWVVVGDT